MGRITKKLTAAVMAAALLFSGCGKEAQVFQKVEDMMLFGSRFFGSGDRAVGGF